MWGVSPKTLGCFCTRIHQRFVQKDQIDRIGVPWLGVNHVFSFDCKVQQDFGHKCGAQVLLGLTTGLKQKMKLCFAENGTVNK